ncbi:Rv0909 family putative TA system antitoxin [Agrococcus sp. SL85]|uniref:Rv0909 family putative TA system antitoxin n=1 Tax=Agrococcus sp. SL85 TaxID=2995141 RepID=UPI00226CE759|nr:Rv0909 family putative TA system antitoxin [Agrococcus sp. SL85]WAC66857.1 Rv0909 family putative TA system antitoxin [Agrococcus sp. SL85]
MGALDDLTKKAQEFVEQNKEQIDQVLSSEQAEQFTDGVLGTIAEKADQVTGGKHSEKIEEVRATLDGKVGDQ